ncbi:hypothetical protein J4G33_16090 [Actinotalea sp. BY-33]|uniref:Uncharacterized protein n=1 Tax=Actinotalea soli TaxID=2819234 RepID=A0A939LV83_9CELL|nr:hypothetical protein [Actinotalea soli]MBO1753330.1 hypothetical protein [Actinotalea soli]
MTRRALVLVLGTLGLLATTTLAAAAIHAAELLRSRAEVEAELSSLGLDVDEVLPLDLVELFWWSTEWSVGATGLALLAWVAAAHSRARGGRGRPTVLVTGALLGGWVGAYLTAEELASGSFAVPWPGPQVPYVWEGDDLVLTLVHPATTAPLVLLVSVALAVLLSRWTPLTAPPRASTTSARVAGLVAGSLGLTLLTVYAVAHVHAVGEISRWTSEELVAGAATLLVVVLVAAIASGDVPWSAPVLGLISLATLRPLVAQWSWGGPDSYLLAGLAACGALACAWGWRPLARGLDRLVAE